MIDKEDLLNNKDFYKSFKNGEDLTSFFKEMHKRAVEHMLDAELDTHLDNEKHQKSITGNYRNGHGIKKIKSSFGDLKLKFPEIEKVVLNRHWFQRDTTLSMVWRILSSHFMLRE